MRKLSLILGGLLVAAPALAQPAPSAPAPAAKPTEAAKPADATAPAKPADAAKPDAPKPDAPKPDAAPGEGPKSDVTKPAAVEAVKGDAAGATNVALPAATDATPPKAALDLHPAAAAPPAKAPNTLVFAPQQSVYGPTLEEGEDKWKFEFHGYVRAPMRVGMGKRSTGYGCPSPPRDPRTGLALAGAAVPACPTAPNQSMTTLHAPLLPDDQYLGWQHTNHNPRDWAEMFFSYGNSQARGTVSVQGYNFAETSFVDPTTQFGIGQGYVDLTPDLGFEDVRLSLRAGAFWNKYGQAGRYDGGEYDTYLFGRTHNSGETLHLDYDIDPENTLWLEHGVGAKRPDPSIYNNTRFTMLQHGHVGFNHGEDMKFTANILYSWAHEEERPSTSGTMPGAAITNISDGRMWVGGADARFELGAFGYLYAGYSHIGLKNAVIVGRAIEVLHASGGGEFQLGATDNYLGPSCSGNAAVRGLGLYNQIDPNGSPIARDPAFQGCSLGNGSVDSLLAQYEFSLTNFTQQIDGGQRFWGEGSDLTVVLYGMYNKVASDYAPNDGIHKLKYGTDLRYSALSWLLIGLRADRVQPNSRVPEQSFAVLSPRLTFRSKWNTHEAVTLQYSHYFYNTRTCSDDGLITPADYSYQRDQKYCVQPPSAPVPPDGFGATNGNQNNQRGAPNFRPDENVFNIQATMWW